VDSEVVEEVDEVVDQDIPAVLGWVIILPQDLLGRTVMEAEAAATVEETADHMADKCLLPPTEEEEGHTAPHLKRLTAMVMATADHHPTHTVEDHLHHLLIHMVTEHLRQLMVDTLHLLLVVSQIHMVHRHLTHTLAHLHHHRVMVEEEDMVVMAVAVTVGADMVVEAEEAGMLVVDDLRLNW
jgi:hypothetical protein